jgi:hypothetical protein
MHSWMSLARTGLTLLLWSLGIASTAVAQSGADLLTGTVRGTGGTPLEGAIVEATAAEGGVTRRTTTNDKGRYVLVFPDGAGQYRLSVRAIGYAPVTRTVQRIGDDDRIVTDVAMTNAPVQLQELVTRGRPAPAPQFERAPPGTSERVFDADRTARLPVEVTDLAALAALTPGVVTTGASDSTPAQITIAGQRPTANNVTLDGISFGADLLPQDGIRATRVITNSYDVARGQFSGGQIATTTRAGTNVVQGSFTTIFRDDALAAGSGTESAFGRGFDQQQVSGGIGGPIIRDRLFVFASGQGRFRRDALPSLLDADAASLARLGVAPDSAARFLALAQGTGAAGPLLTGQRRASDGGSGLLRLDWLVLPAHTLTVRGDYRNAGSDPARVGPLSLPGTGGLTSSSGGGVFASLSSRFGTHLINEFRGYWSSNEQRSDALLAVPAARVLVASALPDGAQGVATLGFGGNAGLPTRGEARALEITEELQFLPGAGTHRVKLGALVSRQRFEQDVTQNRFGTFFYPSLDALAANTPASFTRTLAPVIRRGEYTNSALWLGDIWRVSDRFQATYGLRAEQTVYAGAPARNADIEAVFGLRTDRLPADRRISPRVGFTWTMPGAAGQPPRTFIRGGVGEFRSVVPVSLIGALQGLSGLADAEQQLTCVGVEVPVPDWSAYAAAGAIPSSCADGGAGGGPTLVATAPTVAVLGERFAAPRAWRGSLGVTRRIWSTFTIGFDASYARGTAQTGARDANLRTDAAFTLAAEGGRSVYADPRFIVPATGQTALGASRVDPAFGRVLVLDSDLRNDAVQVTASIGGLTRRGALLNLSYTFSRVRDQSSFAGGSPVFALDAPTTAGNPNLREWAASDQERRHQVVGTATYPFTPALELTATARLLSGAPYTPIVSGDVNGDGGARNDRAFVFDPATADAELAAGLRSVLASSAGASCLARQVGRVAARNTCRGPWQPAFDLQLNWRPTLLGLDRRFTASLTTVNLLGGLDQLFHADDALRGWGGFIRPDPVLLAVTGFDPNAQRFRYSVNERFGTTASAIAFRQPFQIGVQFRYAIGPDPVRDRLRSAFGGGPRGAGGGAGAPVAQGPGGAFARFLQANPIRRILEQEDLALTDAQRTTLQPLADSLDVQGRAALAEVQSRVEKAGANPDFAALFGGLRPLLESAQRAVRASLQRAEQVLTAEQWAKVPADVKTPFGGRRGPGGGPGGPGGPPPF